MQRNRISVLIDLKIFGPMSVIAGTLYYVSTLSFMFNTINVLVCYVYADFDDM